MVNDENYRNFTRTRPNKVFISPMSPIITKKKERRERERERKRKRLQQSLVFIVWNLAEASLGRPGFQKSRYIDIHIQKREKRERERERNTILQ